jgi:hypothetical protein
VIFSEVSIKVDVVVLNLLGKVGILSVGHLFIAHFATILLHASDCRVKAVSEDFDSLDGVLLDVVVESITELPEVVHVDIESSLLADH